MNRRLGCRPTGYPRAAEGRATDGGAIHLHQTGVPTLYLGVPCRYIHSHSGIIQTDDYDSTLKLLLELIKRLDAKTVKGLAP